MAGSRVQRPATYYVQPQIGGGDELRPQLTGKDAVQTFQDLARPISTVHERLHCHLDHGSNQCGGNTMPRDVCHQKAYSVLVLRNKFIEVAGHGSHRMVSSADIETCDFWNTGRKNRRLDLPCDGKLLFNRDQAATIGKDPLGHDVS